MNGVEGDWCCASAQIYWKCKVTAAHEVTGVSEVEDEYSRCVVKLNAKSHPSELEYTKY